MNRPNKEDFHQDKTGQNLMNGPYNQTAYAIALDKYIDHLESKNNFIDTEIEDELPMCYECMIIKEQEELDMFGGLCETCFEDVAD